MTPAAPKPKMPRRTRGKPGGKFLLALLLIVILLVLLVVSVLFRLKGDETVTTAAPEAIAAIMPYVGGIGYGL